MNTTIDKQSVSKASVCAALYKFINQRSGMDYRNYGEREALIEASRAFSGRLQFIVRDDGYVGVDYTTGQYFPTEYRIAACAVLAQAIWDHWRPDCGTGEDIRRKARREFGRAIASTWFN